MYYSIVNYPGNNELFSLASDYGKKILGVFQYETLWAVVIRWQDVRPINPGNFGGKNTFEVLLANSVRDEAIAVFRYNDIDWSVKALRIYYRYFQRASYLPVVGWNSANPLSFPSFQNFARSGTVNVADVDGYYDPVLDSTGEIGINLRGNIPVLPCILWVFQQFLLGRGSGRINCREPCAPTYYEAEITLQSRWSYLIKRTKFSPIYPYYSKCVFSYYRWYDPNLRAVECCYHPYYEYLIDTPIPGAGRAHKYHPARDISYYSNHYSEEESAYSSCCNTGSSFLCRLFYSLRPPCTSRNWEQGRASWASAFGEPHFVTVDGMNYTFNGCGWYTYFKAEIPGMNESKLIVQVRTTRVGDVNATGFTGIAVQEGNSEVIQVNLQSSGDIHLEVNKTEFSIGENGTDFESGVYISLINKTFSIETPLGTTIRVRKAANDSVLSIITGFLPLYENYSMGLMGKWNGNITDDFTLPNGTVLPTDMSESDIFYKFGEEWRVPENEAIYQNIDDDDAKFTCPDDFVPIFSEEALSSLDENLASRAKEVCGDDITCLFDIAATKQVSFGQSTLSESTQIRNEIAILANNEPVFTQNITVLNVTLGQRFVLSLEATDADDDELTFDVPNIPPDASFNSTGNFLYFIWYVNSTEETNVTFLVQDTKNGSSTLSPSITLCGCVNGGICFVPQASSPETEAVASTFLVMSCNCSVGQTGEFCEEQKDFCRGETTTPCHPLVTCTNHPTNFTCSPCPTGYEGDGMICTDIDECGNGTDGCDQLCTNTDGSFLCGCGSGFTLDQDGKLCNDIDECSQPNDCSQLCNNTLGSYECFCRIGFKINEIDMTECAAQTECRIMNDCVGNAICYVDILEPGVEKCTCPAGYILGEDQNSCEDINECEATESNLCGQICTNMMGSYTCSCRDGYVATSPTACEDFDECFEGNFSCPGAEECDNLAGSYRCLCPERLNMVRVNGTCQFRDVDTVEDMADPPPDASPEQEENAIEITLKNFQSQNYTVDVNVKFKDSVVQIVNEFCNENRFRPQDCGVSQNQILFNELNVERLQGYPNNSGANATIMFYVDYPSTVRPGSLPKAILASIVFSKLEELQNLTGYCIVLNTPVAPLAPQNPTDDQRANAVVLQILDFSVAQWTISYDNIFRRSIALSLTSYCKIDEYSRTQDCEFSGLETSYNLTHVGRIPGYPENAAGNVVNASFYVTNPSKLTPVPQKVLASMLLSQESDVEIALTLQVVLRTFAGPDTPLVASDEKNASSVVIRISSFTEEKWTYLNDRRLRRAISNRITKYCNETSQRRLDCQITGRTAEVTESDVHRTSPATPSNSGGNNIDYSFYVNYPNQSVPMVQNILSSIVKFELQSMQIESALFFSLETSFSPSPPNAPTSEQSSNIVEIRILNQQAKEWTAIEDNRLRNAVANRIRAFCSSCLVACVVMTSDQPSFQASHVTRNESSPVQSGDNLTYTLFVDYPSGSGSVQQNLLAGILAAQAESIENETNLEIEIITSTLASSPPVSNPDQTSQSVTIIARGIIAAQWSAIQDNNFRGCVAQAIVEYCTANEAQREECKLPTNDVSFTQTHVQRVQGSPTQDGDDSEIEFYVTYPGAGTMSADVLILIMTAKIASIGTCAKMNLVLVIPEIATPPPANESEIENAVCVLLANFLPNEWPTRDSLFRRNMAEQIQEFCGTSSFYDKLCNITQNDLNSLTYENIQRLPNSPTQNGNDSILKFYASLPSGMIIPKSILATIFVEKQNQILFSLGGTLENFTEIFSPDEINLTSQQKENAVPILILNFPVSKFTSLRRIDVKHDVARRMNRFCFTTNENTCSITRSRKKRAVGNERFSDSDITVNSVKKAGENTTNASVVVNEPGEENPVPADIVREALYESIQEDDTTNITGLQLALFMEPVVSNIQRANAINVSLINTHASQWTFEDEISFRENMSKAIKQFCGMSDVHLDLCNLTRRQLDKTNVLNVQTLPESPINGTNATLSFFVYLHSGTMSMELLTTIFMLSLNVLSQPNRVTSPATKNPVLTNAQRDNLVPLSLIIKGSQDLFYFRLDIQVSIANRLNEYCQNNSEAQLCPSSRNFTKDDILVVIYRENGTASFVVIDPESNSPLSVNQIQETINGKFMSILYDLSLTIPSNDVDDEHDWPLILGLSIVGALLVLFLIVSVVYAVVVHRGKEQGKVRGMGWKRSVYSGHSDGGWQFNRDSPYTGSPFSAIDGIPGFDDDGLPSNI